MQKRKFDELVSYFNKKVSEMEIETKYKMELLGMVTALGCAHEKEMSDLSETKRESSDTISRQAAINTVSNWLRAVFGINSNANTGVFSELLALPSAEPVIRCKDCRWAREARGGNIECFVDSNMPEYHGYEWFCPNGERRTDE